MVTKKLVGGLLLLVILTASVYLVFDNKYKILVENTRTQYFVNENSSWVLAATEYVNLFDGTTKMRASSRDINYSFDNYYTTIVRTSEWKDNITTIQTYVFENNATDIEEVPIKNTLECINCVGKIVHYEIRDILYEGETEVISSPFEFGHNMKISWQDGAYYSKVFQQKVASDKIIIRYRPEDNYETYEVRLFDPSWWNSSFLYKKEITINETSGEDLINFSVLMNVSYEENMLNDFADLRFVNSTDDVELGYWIENKSDGAYAWIWVNVNLTASSNNTIYMYYGNNTEVESNSNENKTFWFYYYDDSTHQSSSHHVVEPVTEVNVTLWDEWEYKIAHLTSYKSGTTWSQYAGAGFDYDGTSYRDGDDVLLFGSQSCDAGGIYWEDDPSHSGCRFGNPDGEIASEGTYTHPSTYNASIGDVHELTIFQWIDTSGKTAQIRLTQFILKGYASSDPIVYFGEEEELSGDAPNITLNAPEDTYNSSSQTIVFNCTGTDDQLVQNISLILNSTYNETLVRSYLFTPSNYLEDIYFYYSLNDSTNSIIDYSGNGINGTNSGGQLNSQGYVDDGIYFSGGYSQYINGTSTPLISPKNGSVVFWVNITNRSDENYLFLSSGNLGNLYMRAGLTSSGNLKLNFYDYDSTPSHLEKFEVDFIPNLNEWYQIGYSWGDAGRKIYVNGTLIDSDLSYLGNGGSSDHDPGLYIGSLYMIAPQQKSINGTIDDVILWNRSLSDEEFSLIYKEYNNIKNETTLTLITTKTLDDGAYNWTCEACDNDSQCTNATPRQVNIDTTYPLIEFIAYTEDNNSYVSQDWILANVSMTEINPKNVTYRLWKDITYCYQESVNVSNQTGIDGNCGLNYSGNYSFEDYYFYINYTKPEGVFNAKWLVKHGTLGIYNITILPECFNDLIELRIISNGTDDGANSVFWSRPQCYNTTHWIDIGSLSNGTVTSFSLNYDNNWSKMYDGDWNTYATFITDLGATQIWDNLVTGDAFRSTVYEEGMYWVYSNTTTYELSDVTENNTINWTDLSNGEYFYNVTICDSFDLCNSTETRYITLDTTEPMIYLETENNTIEYMNRTPTFSFNVSDNLNDTLECLLYLNNGSDIAAGINSSVLNATSTSITSNTTLANGNYTWWVNCSDGLQENKSVDYRINISVVPPSVTLNSPENAYNSSSSSITFNCSATSLSGNLTNMSLILNGVYNESIDLEEGICYQESVNVSNQTGIDGNCGLNYSGNWSSTATGTIPVSAVFDGLWVSSYNRAPFTDYYHYINYSIPSSSFGAIWKSSMRVYPYNQPISNETIDVNCLSGDFLQIRISQLGNSTLYGQCYNGTDWIGAYNSMSSSQLGNTNIDEEAVYWNVSFGSNYTLTATKTLSDGLNQNWTCEACSAIGCTKGTSRNISVDTLYPGINFDDPTPDNNSAYGASYLDIAVRINESNTNNVTYRIYNDTGVIWNETTYLQDSKLDNVTINWTPLAEDTYLYNVTACDDFDQCNSTGTRYVVIDNTYPLIDYEDNSDPINESGDFDVKDWVFVNVSVTETNEKNITFTLWDVSGIENQTTYTTAVRDINWTDLPESMWFWNVTVCDDASLCNTTSTRHYGVELVNLSFEGTYDNVTAELGGNVSISAINTNNTVCIDIDHPDYGLNYSCASQNNTINLDIDYFRKTTFANGNEYQNRTFSGDNISINITGHEYDEIDNLTVNISSDDSLKDIIFYNTNSSSIDRIFYGYLIGSNIYQNVTYEDESSKNFTYVGEESKETYLEMDGSSTLINLSFNVTGFEYGFSTVDWLNNSFENIDRDTPKTTAHLSGGFITAQGTDPVSMTYDDFDDDSISDILWSFGLANGAGNTDPGDPDEGYDYTIANFEGGDEISLYVTGFDEDWSGDERGTDTLSNTMWSNISHMNIWTAEGILLQFDYSFTAHEDEEYGDCIFYNQVQLGDKTAWQSQRDRCKDRGELTYDCDDHSLTLEPIILNITKNLNNSWNVSISGVELTYGDYVDRDDSDCGTRYIVYNYSNGSKHTYFTGYDDSGGDACEETLDSYETLSNTTMISDLDWNISDQLYFKQFMQGSWDNEDGTGCEYYSNPWWNISYVNQTLLNRSNGTVYSYSMYSSEQIPKATLNVSNYTNSTLTGDNITLYMSADNVNYESVIEATEHTFTNSGGELTYKIEFNITNTGYVNSTPMIYNINISTPQDNASNVDFDFGDDGNVDYTISGDLTNTQTINISSATLSSVFSGIADYGDYGYYVPLIISSDTPGIIQISAINLTYNPNPVSLNVTKIYDFMNTYGANETNFTINLSSNSTGTINLTDLRYDYAGGNDTIVISASNDDDSQIVTRNITYYYSKWDYNFVPSGINFLEFSPRKPTSDNVTPYGQSSSTPILNITNYGYGGRVADLSVYVNDSLECVNLTISTDNNKSNGVMVNESWNNLSQDLDYLDSVDIWMWADFECDYSTWNYFNPYIYFRQCANNSLCSEEVL